MTNSKLNQLIGLTGEDLELLNTVGNIGAATAEEVALNLNRPGEDLSPQMDQLVQHKLLEVRTATIGDETIKIYLVDPLIQKTLKRRAYSGDC
jgi:hypothetical protein